MDLYNLLISDSILGLFIQVLPISFFSSLIYFTYQVSKLRHANLVPMWRKLTLRTVFVCYLTGLLNLTLAPNNLWTYIWFYLYNGFEGCTIGPLFTFDYNLMPSLIQYMMGNLTIGSWVKTMLLGNFFMFLPMGLLLPMVSSITTIKRILPLSITIPLVIETLQPFVGRSFDIDDLIANFCGIIVGYCIFGVGRRLTKELTHTTNT